MTPLGSWMGHDPSARWAVRHQSNAPRPCSSRPAAVSAIAFSMWSHGSVWPPSNHGMAPEDSCVAAIDCAVWRHCAGVNTPRTAGTSYSGNGHLGLPEIQGHALADKWIHQRFSGAGQPWPAHHVPHQQLVVGGDGGMIVLRRSHSTFQPPERRVQCVRVMRMGEPKPVAEYLVTQR